MTFAGMLVRYISLKALNIFLAVSGVVYCLFVHRAETLHVQKTPLLDHTAIRSAAVTTNPTTGAPQIEVELSEVGSELFAEITKANINKRLAIVLDGQLYSAPVIRSEIPGGKVLVTGSFTEDEARALAAKINDAVTGK